MSVGLRKIFLIKYPKSRTLEIALIFSIGWYVICLSMKFRKFRETEKITLVANIWSKKVAIREFPFQFQSRNCEKFYEKNAQVKIEWNWMWFHRYNDEIMSIGSIHLYLHCAVYKCAWRRQQQRRLPRLPAIKPAQRHATPVSTSRNVNGWTTTQQKNAHRLLANHTTQLSKQ